MRPWTITTYTCQGLILSTKDMRQWTIIPSIHVHVVVSLNNQSHETVDHFAIYMYRIYKKWFGVLLFYQNNQNISLNAIRLNGTLCTNNHGYYHKL